MRSASIAAGERAAKTMSAALALAVLAPSAIAADAPLSYLESSGARADATLPLTWGLIAISLAVVVVVAALVLGGSIARRASRIGDAVSDPNATRWVVIGVGVSTIVLVFALLWTIRVLAVINAPASKPAITVDVTAQQWWWNFRYASEDVSRTLRTANELHIPVGVPVRIRLHAADVIHSFWVPRLGGKTDAIPGQTNATWIEADRPGRYQGQCVEYCGLQHAHMQFLVIAEPRAEFDRWYDAQLGEAPAPSRGKAVLGEHDFEVSCGACHTVRGTPAGGVAGPDLTHLMSRATIAAGAAPNTPPMLAAWIADPQTLKPGNHMPTLQLTGAEIDAIRTYLETLR